VVFLKDNPGSDDQLPLPNIDWDAASAAWRHNKIAESDGSFRYRPEASQRRQIKRKGSSQCKKANGVLLTVDSKTGVSEGSGIMRRPATDAQQAPLSVMHGPILKSSLQSAVVTTAAADNETAPVQQDSGHSECAEVSRMAEAGARVAWLIKFDIKRLLKSLE